MIIVILCTYLVSSAMASFKLDFNDLLLQFGSKLASKWYQLGKAVGIGEEMLDECSNSPPEEAIVDILDYWIKNHIKPSWENVTEVLNEIGFNELANNLLKGAYSLPIIIL